MTAVSNPLNDIAEINKQIHNYDTAKGKLNAGLGNYPTLYKLNRGIPMGINDVIRARVDKKIIEDLANGIIKTQDFYRDKCDANDTPSVCQRKITVCNDLITQLGHLHQIKYGGKRKTSKGYSKRSDRKRKNTKRNRKYRSQKA